MTRAKLIPSPGTSAAVSVFGGQVRIARQKLGWTIQTLATRSGVSARTVSLLERGEPQVSIGNAIEIALAAGVPVFGTTHTDQLLALERVQNEAIVLLPARVIEPDWGTDNDF